MRDNCARWLGPGDSESLSAALATRFTQVFEREAEGVWFAPGRANLNGEHIDFHGGRCLPMALRHGTYVAAAAREDGLLRVRTLDPQLDSGIIEIHDDAGSPAEADLPSWTTYVWGVLQSLRECDPEYDELHLPSGFGADVLIRSTLPIGAGLSSSASLECAVALALVGTGAPFGEEHGGEDFTRALTDELRTVLAEVCIRAETEYVGAGTGGLDQTASLRGAAGKLVSLDCRDFTVKRSDISFLLRDYRFIAVETGQPHELADGRFAARRAESEAAAALLGVKQLREALPEKPKKPNVELTLEEFDRLVDEGGDLGGHDAGACRRRLKHALTEMLRSEKIHKLLIGEAHGVDDTAEMIGDLMAGGHTSMRDYAEVSFEMADRVVETALSAGATGARLIGGGFGGSVLLLVRKNRVDAVTAALTKLSEQLRFLDAVPSAPARAV